MSFALKAFVQVEPLKIMGKVYESGNESAVIVDAEVLLLLDTDTIVRFRTDKFGRFSGYPSLQLNRNYKLVCRHAYFSDGIFELKVDNFKQTIIYDIGLNKMLIDFGPALYEFNQVKILTERDSDYIKYFYKEKDRICIKITHYKLKEESDSIAQIRIKNYENHMIKCGYQLNQFSIDLEIKDCTNLKECMATTEGIVISIERNCFELKE